MKLGSKLVLTTTLTALVVLGISEWLSYRETMEFFGSHLVEMRVDQNTDGASSLERGLATLSERLIWIHLGHAALEALTLVLLLSLFWTRLVLEPIDNILEHMNAMGHSVTCKDITVDREDEFGQVAKELNRLARKLTTTISHVATGSELSTMALIGQTLLRRVSLAQDQLAVASKQVCKAQLDGLAPPASAVERLELVRERLASLPDMFEAEFRKRLHTLGYDRQLPKESQQLTP